MKKLNKNKYYVVSKYFVADRYKTHLDLFSGYKLKGDLHGYVIVPKTGDHPTHFITDVNGFTSKADAQRAACDMNCGYFHQAGKLGIENPDLIAHRVVSGAYLMEVYNVKHTDELKA